MRPVMTSILALVSALVPFSAPLADTAADVHAALAAAPVGRSADRTAAAEAALAARPRAASPLRVAAKPRMAMATGAGPVQAAPRSPEVPVDLTSGGPGLAVDALKLLESLRVNAPAAAPAPSGRDKPLAMSPGRVENVVLTIGGARTVQLPGPYDKAIVVMPDVADVVVVAPGQAQVIARQSGVTDVVFSNPEGAVFKVHVTVGVDAAPVQQALDSALKGERITATAMNGTIYLSGTTRDSAAAATAVAIARRFVTDQQNGVINQIQVLGGQQVLLQVRVAEVRRTVMKQLGLNSALDFKNGSVVGNAPTLYQYGKNGTSGESALSALSSAAATNGAGFVSQKMLGGVLTSVLNALESEGLVKTLAEPNLVAISGKTANMLAGGEYPVPQVDSNGNVAAQYRNFGVSLGFTPSVLSPSAIGLDIATEVSSRGENVAFPVGSTTVNIPVFNTRKANTTVEIPSGGSIVIAGLLQSDFQNTLAGLPGVKDIPILGKLASSSEFQRNETELVIAVTAYLVEPTDAAKVALPSDGLLPPSDADLYLLNRLSGMYGKRAAPPPGIERNFGYITE